MAIQSSINSLLSQAQSLAAFYKGFEKAGDFIKGQEAQTEATQNLQKSFEERFRKEFEIDEKTTLNPFQKKVVEYGEYLEKKRGSVVTPSEAFKLTRHLEKANARRRSIMEAQRAGATVKNEIASDLARASVEARTDSINKTKSNFNEHTASLIRYYGKGSGNP